MKHYNDYIVNFMKRYDYPKEAVKVLSDVEKRLDSDKEFGSAFDKIMDSFKADGDFRKAEESLDELEKASGVDERTLKFIFIMNSSEWVKEKYAEKGISEKVFWDTFEDLKWKLQECMECENTVGTFVASWFRLHLALEIFALGRFQYQLTEYDKDEPYIGSDGTMLKKGDHLVAVHIPSSGISLKDEVRYDSYKKAHEFFKELFPDGITKMECGSWLLYGKHREFLPQHMNILRFMDDFDILTCDEHDSFGDDWRIFGHYSDLPVEEFPTDTSLRKAYKEWLLSGNKSGSGYGIIMFDGENIVNK